MIVKKCRWVLERSQDAPASSACFPFTAFLFVCLYLLCYYFLSIFSALPQHDNGLSLLLSLQFPLPHPSYVSISSGLRARNVTLAWRDRAAALRFDWRTSLTQFHSVSLFLCHFSLCLSLFLSLWTSFVYTAQPSALKLQPALHAMCCDH